MDKERARPGESGSGCVDDEGGSAAGSWSGRQRGGGGGVTRGPRVTHARERVDGKTRARTFTPMAWMKAPPHSLVLYIYAFVRFFFCYERATCTRSSRELLQWTTVTSDFDLERFFRLLETHGCPCGKDEADFIRWLCFRRTSDFFLYQGSFQRGSLK